MTEELTHYDEVSHILCPEVVLELFPVGYESSLQKLCVPYCQGDDNLPQTRASCSRLGFLYKVDQPLVYVIRSHGQRFSPRYFPAFGSRVRVYCQCHAMVAKNMKRLVHVLSATLSDPVCTDGDFAG